MFLDAVVVNDASLKYAQGQAYCNVMDGSMNSGIFFAVLLWTGLY